MKLVVDTNVLITYFWPRSVFRTLLGRGMVDCIAPEYALEEINNYKEHIKNKTKQSEKLFLAAREELAMSVTFIPLAQYQQQLKQAVRISPDPNDCDFFALALTEKLPLWSNDALLKKQTRVVVLSTADVLSSKAFMQADWD